MHRHVTLSQIGFPGGGARFQLAVGRTSAPICNIGAGPAVEGVSRRGSRGLSSKATLVRAEYTGYVGMSVCRRMACPRAHFGLLKVGEGGRGDRDGTICLKNRL